MKKFSLIIFPVIALIIGLSVWQRPSYSQTGSPHAEECKDQACCIAYRDGIDAMRTDWDKNLSDIRDQQKPASDMTDEAFENLRTYHCWLQYLCSSVLHSAVANPLTVQGTGITSAHIQTIPGCQAPEEMTMGGTWSTFVDTLREVPLLGLVGEALPGDFFQGSKLNFIPQCMTSPNNDSPEISTAEAYHTSCVNLINREMEISILALKTGMKKTNSDQKARALENKLHGIITKMTVMQTHTEYLKSMLNSLEMRYPCFPGYCS